MELDGDSFTIEVTNQPSFGNLEMDFEDGSFTYTPHTGNTQTDSFTYKLRDEHGTLSVEEATVTIMIGPNNAPVARNNSFTTSENTPLTIEAPGVLENDEDMDGDALSAFIETLPSNGDLDFSTSGDGSFTYTPGRRVYGSG